MLSRLKQVLPLKWFPDATPVLDTILSGIAWAWAWCFDLLQTAKAQARISTAEGFWLDLIAQDFFGAGLPRRPGEIDSAYQARIKAELIRERGTRAAVSTVLLELTGQSPLIFEPANTFDTGGYGNSGGAGGGLGYGTAGGWGSLSLPFQFFVTTCRPSGSGVPSVSGWSCGAGGYCEGAIEYATASVVQGPVSDEEIYDTIAGVLPLCTVAWTRILS